MARTSLELSTQDGAIRVLAAGIRSGQRLADMRPNGRPGWTESSHLVDGEGNPCSSLVESQARLAGGLLVTTTSPSAEKIRGSSLPLPMLSVAWPPVQYTRRSIWYFASLFPQRFDQSSRQGRINPLVVVHQYQPVKPWLIHLNISRRGDPRFVVKATLRTQKICQRQDCG
ncbi:hypothetical protein N5P37_008039 [Trichoderma harzianum]|nr:hypothetical protein N5P37_008039 [Trichoderma harzianum]